MAQYSDSFSMIDSTPASSHNTAIGLLSLPQEILDMIFDLAYPRLDRFQIITKSAWNARENEWRKTTGASYDYQPFPTPKACSFLVSKEFFVNAARAYIGNQTFDERSSMSPQGYFIRPGKVHEGIAIQWMKDLVLRGWMLKYARLGPDIRMITLHVDDRMFEDLEPTKFVWETRLDEKDFQTVVRKQGLDRLSNVLSFTVKPSVPSYANTREKRNIFLDNVERFRLFAWRCISRKESPPRLSDRIESRLPQPLYHGSLVYYGPAGRNARSRKDGQFNSSGTQGLFNEDFDGISRRKKVLPDALLRRRCDQRATLHQLPYHPLADDAEGLIDAIEAIRREEDMSASDYPVTTPSPSLMNLHTPLNLSEEHEGGASLRDEDIPDDSEKLQALLVSNTWGLLAWIREVKELRLREGVA